MSKSMGNGRMSIVVKHGSKSSWLKHKVIMKKFVPAETNLCTQDPKSEPLKPLSHTGP